MFTINRNGQMLFGSGKIESAYEYLSVMLKGKVWLTTPNVQLNVLVSIVLSTGGLITLETE